MTISGVFLANLQSSDLLNELPIAKCSYWTVTLRM
jgi:hypothetical protein